MTDPVLGDGLGGGLTALIAVVAWSSIGVALVIWLVVVPLGLRGIFEALGASRGKAWVPFVNIATVYRLGGFSEYWLVGLVIPLFNAVAAIILIVASHRITKRLGHSGAWTVLAVFAWWLWALILGLLHADARPAEPLVWSVQQRPAPVVPLRSDHATTPPPPFAAAADAAPPAFAPIAPPPAAAPVEPLPQPVAAPPASEPEATRPEPAVPQQPAAEPAADPAGPQQTASYPRHELDPELHAAIFEQSGPPASAPAAPAGPAAAIPPQPIAEPDDDATILTSGLDQTMISTRRRPHWWLHTTAGAHVELETNTAIVGRRPAAHPLYPGAQLVTVSDPATSVSATHAALELIDGSWQITDLGSTNGVWLVDEHTGGETELGSRNRARVTPRFLLGELGVQVMRDA